MPPPSAGLDLVSPIDNMSPEYALELVNVFPGPTAPITRGGYSQYANISATNTSVDTLVNYSKTDGTSELIAVANGATPGIFSITVGSATNITGTTAISPSGTNMQAEQFGSRLYLCNGLNNVQVYDGATVADSTFTGVALDSLISVSSYRERLYFVEKNSLSVWYGGTKAIGVSALTQFDFQYVFRRGGYLLFAGSYTNQTAQTSQDLFFALSSEGEIVFYAGSSPDSTTNWSIVARYENIGRPLGYRAVVRVNSDVWILTNQGIVPISVLFQSDPEQAQNSVSSRVNPLITQYSNIVPFSGRWHGVFWPQGRRVFINVPSSESSTLMLVFSIDTRGWCVYELANRGDGITLAVSDGEPFYGGNEGFVFLAEDGLSDNGEAIAFAGRTAFSFYDSRGNFKAFKDIRPLLKTRRGVNLTIGLDTDFQRRDSLDSITTGSGITTPWGSDWGSDWPSETEFLFNRFATRGQGHSAAVRFSGSLNNSECQIFGFEVRFDQGGQV